MTAIRAIHACRKTLGLDEDAARDIYARVTGKASLKLMTAAEQDTLAAEFKRLAGAGRRPDGRQKLTGKYAGKLQALWIGAWNLGLIRNRDDAALLAFVKRQCRVDHIRFLTEAEDAAKAIEALKGWMAREAGVNWATGDHLLAVQKLAGYKIARAQMCLLRPDIAHVGYLIGRALGDYAHDKTGRHVPELLQERDWQPVMNALGLELRAAKGEA